MKRILVVDDDPTILNLLRRVLPILGFKADIVNSGNRAVELLETRQYDLILSDIHMPEMNGIEVAAAAFQNCPQTPVLFMSSGSNVKVEEQSFLAKPFTIAQLKAKLSSLLDKNTSALRSSI